MHETERGCRAIGLLLCLPAASLDDLGSAVGKPLHGRCSLSQGFCHQVECFQALGGHRVDAPAGAGFGALPRGGDETRLLHLAEHAVHRPRVDAHQTACQRFDLVKELVPMGVGLGK